MRTWAVAVVCLWGASVSLSGAACAQPMSIPSEALSIALQAMYDKPVGVNGRPFTPTIVIAEGVPLPQPLTVFGVEAALRTRAQAREAQLAWFVYLARIAQTPEGWLIDYQQPHGARFGTLRVRREGEDWVLGEQEKMRSSFGARLFYGELYEGVTCRPGSEMAQRWAMQRDAMGMAGAGAASSEPVRCPGDEFPEVAAYRQARRLGLIGRD